MKTYKVKIVPRRSVIKQKVKAESKDKALDKVAQANFGTSNTNSSTIYNSEVEELPEQDSLPGKVECYMCGDQVLRAEAYLCESDAEAKSYYLCNKCYHSPDLV